MGPAHKPAPTCSPRCCPPSSPLPPLANNGRRRLIDTARAAPEGTAVVIDGVHCRRSQTRSRYDYRRPSQIWADVLHTEPGARPVPLERGHANLSKLEEDAFWAWALVETLRHSGVRIEELLELIQLSLRHYTSPSTNTLVPLHIVPSKTDAERLIPMSPELVTVLLAVQRRAKNGSDQVPLSVRYDPDEKTHGDPLPHLFARSRRSSAIRRRVRAIQQRETRRLFDAEIRKIVRPNAGVTARAVSSGALAAQSAVITR